MKKLLITMHQVVLYSSISIIFLINNSFADVPAEQLKEVSHLIAFVKNSPCIFNRNGAKHPGKESVKHIQRKYDYFRDDIASTKDFIKYSATKSTMSGKYYTVICPGEKTIKSQDWLLTELMHFRSMQQ